MAEHLIVWAEEEGGLLMARWGSEAEYEEIVQSGRVVRGMSLFGVLLSGVEYVALCKVERDHDFILGGPREAERS